MNHQPDRIGLSPVAQPIRAVFEIPAEPGPPAHPPADSSISSGTDPAPDPRARRFVDGLAKGALGTFIANVSARVLLVQGKDYSLPVVVSDGHWGDSYVASPHSTYVLYPQAELDMVDLGHWKRLARLLIGAADQLLRGLRINHAVQIDNWLLSTNLHGSWTGQGLADLRTGLMQRFPDHYFVIRSVDRWSSPVLMRSLRADGWLMLPSRQIWVTDDVERDWASRKSVKNDLRKLAQSGLVVEDVARLSDSDAARVAELYTMLYIRKYSLLNPQYTPRWMQMAVACGLFHLRVARDADGLILAAAAIVVRGGIATNPMLGYDMQQPQAAGLYRIASCLVGDYARRHKLKLHGSAGAGHFKQQRGARSEIEFTAIHAAHLVWWRRWPLVLVAMALKRLAIPVMQNRML